jgi:hypothetical protein
LESAPVSGTKDNRELEEKITLPESLKGSLLTSLEMQASMIRGSLVFGILSKKDRIPLQKERESRSKPMCFMVVTVP